MEPDLMRAFSRMIRVLDNRWLGDNAPKAKMDSKGGGKKGVGK